MLRQAFGLAQLHAGYADDAGRFVSLPAQSACHRLAPPHRKFTRAPPLEGAVRFGAPDDFGTRFLPNMLLRYSRTHPRVEVEARLGTSMRLERELNEGRLDLILLTADDNARSTHGQVVHREPLLGTGLRAGNAHPRRPLPLALAPADSGCAWRRLALESPDRAGLEYRVAHSGEHCAGQHAAMLADLAIAPFPSSLILAPKQVLGAEHGLPSIGHYQVELLRAPTIGAAARALAGHVESGFSQVSSSVIAHED